MRRSTAIGLAAGMILGLFACGDANEGLGSSRSLRRGTPPAAGSVADHDESDTDGADAVDVGNPNADSNPTAPSTAGTSTGSFALALTQNTPSVDLGESVDLDVVVEPKDGYQGTVTFAVTGLPPGITAAPAQATLAGAAATVKVKLTAGFASVPSAPDTSSAIVITGTAGAATATANANLKIAPKLKLTIPLNIDALRAASVSYRDEWGAAFGQSQQALKTQAGNGIVVTVFNADSKAHVIHGASGFAHGSTAEPIQPNAFEMQNNAPRTRTLNVGANVNGYPHDGANGSGASFRIRVEAAP
jgi:hypothetical protein